MRIIRLCTNGFKDEPWPLFHRAEAPITACQDQAARILPLLDHASVDADEQRDVLAHTAVAHIQQESSRLTKAGFDAPNLQWMVMDSRGRGQVGQAGG